MSAALLEHMVFEVIGHIAYRGTEVEAAMSERKPYLVDEHGCVRFLASALLCPHCGEPMRGDDTVTVGYRDFHVECTPTPREVCRG